MSLPKRDAPLELFALGVLAGFAAAILLAGAVDFIGRLAPAVGSSEKARHLLEGLEITDRQIGQIEEILEREVLETTPEYTHPIYIYPVDGAVSDEWRASVERRLEALEAHHPESIE